MGNRERLCSFGERILTDVGIAGAHGGALVPHKGHYNGIRLRCVDNTTGWGTVSKLMRAMEEHRIRSLERPIVLNGFAADGSDSWTIV